MHTRCSNYVIGLIFSVDQNFTTNVMVSVVGVSFDANLNDNELTFPSHPPIHGTAHHNISIENAINQLLFQ